MSKHDTLKIAWYRDNNIDKIEKCFSYENSKNNKKHNMLILVYQQK